MNRLQENVVFAQGGLYSPPSTSKSYPHIHGPKPSDCGARAAGRRWGAKRGCGYVGNSMLTALVFPKCSAEPIESLKLPAREAAPKGCRVYVSGSLQSSTVTAASISEAQRSDPHPPTGAFCSPERIDGGQNGILSKSYSPVFIPLDPENPLLTFRFTADQVQDLHYAALCQIENLERSNEANHPEVLAAIRNLVESMRILERGQPS